MISPSIVFSRTRFLVFLCVSLLGLSSTSLLVSGSGSVLTLHFMILVVWLVGCFPTLIIVLVRFFVRTLLSGTTLGSDASSVVIDLGFCGVLDDCFEGSLLTSCSLQVVVHFAHTLLHHSVRTRCSSVRSLFPSHTSDFHLSANFGAGFPDPFPTSGRCARTVFPNSTNFPRYGPPMAR